MASSFHIENFGCRAARADGEAIAALLRNEGSSESLPAHADVVVVNTCSVTAEADREARAYIRRAHRLNPNARIIATGCYAQRAPDELAALPGVAAVIGNSHKALTPQVASQFMVREASGHDSGNPQSGSRADKARLKRLGALAPAEIHAQIIPVRDLLTTNNPLILSDDTFAHSFLEEAPILPGAQTRPNLKIQEGCSNRCSFCVIPQTRGHSRSLPPDSVLNHVRSFVTSGGNELVLSGINLGRWGRELKGSDFRRWKDLKGAGFSPHIELPKANGALAPKENLPHTLASLIRAIIEQTDLPRLRLSSIEPMDWDTELISLVREFGEGRLARHAHLPLQSGSDAVLRRMHRRYRPWHYAERAAELFCAAGPALTLGADVMVGFPGETDREFQESYDFIQSLPFGYLHLFPFSPRPGTRAWDLYAQNPVPTEVVQERMAALRNLAMEITRTHRAQFIGTELEAITLHTPHALAETGLTSALTENFLPVELAGNLPANRLLRIRITGLARDNALLAATATSANQPDVNTLSTFARPVEPIPQNAF